jgi:hypothetical protein
VSSSTNSTLAVASQVMLSSRSKTALARRTRRCAADPSRASSIRFFTRFRVEEGAADHDKDQNLGRTDSQGI